MLNFPKNRIHGKILASIPTRTGSSQHPGNPPPLQLLLAAVSPTDRSHRPLADPATAHATHNPGSWISHWAELGGERCALVFEREGRSYTRSYTAFEDDVAKLAQLFVERVVVPGDRIAILLDNHPAYLEAVFAGARIGAITLPINTRLAAAELEFILADATPRLVLSDEKSDALLDRVPGAAIDRISVPRDPDDWRIQLRATSPLHDNLPVRADDPMLLMYTSGTTGAPKGALLPHRKALFNSLNAEGCFAIQADDRCLVVTPLFHSLGLHILSLPIFHAGACVVLQSGFDAEAVLESIPRHQITYMGGVPTHYERLLKRLQQSAPSHFDLSSLKFLFAAGAAASIQTIRAFAERGVILKQGYGQTETSMLCCLDVDQALRKAGSVGRPLEHLELRVVNRKSLAGSPANWEDVAASGEEEPGDISQVGEIVVRGPITMLAYWRQEEATRETLREGWLLTGDLARIDREGFITLVGRSREMFISGGENVYPAEVEAAYQKHPAILEIAVVGIPHDEWGEVGSAYVVMAAECDCDPQALREWGREKLASYKLPHSFHAVASLPKTASGKVQKHRLG